MIKNKFLDKTIKSNVTNYLKKHNQLNMEIDFGTIICKEVFDTKISKTTWGNILNYFLRQNKFKLKKDLNYYIYKKDDIQFYLDVDDESRIPKCMKVENLSAIVLNSNDKCYDIKIKTLKKTPTNLNEFEAAIDYDSIVNRKTVSLNFGNMYYLNFSETCDKSKTFYQIKILLSKSIKTKKNNIVNCLSDSIHKIIELQEIEKKIDDDLFSQIEIY